MLLPHELVGKYVAPYLRALVAQELARRGLGQERIARMLGVTQAMVNKYLSWGEYRVLERLAEAGVDAEEALPVALAAAERLMRGDAQGYLEVLTGFANSLLARGVLCRLHRRQGAPPVCEVCRLFFAASSDPLIAEIRRALSIFLNRASAGIVPNVGSNLVLARPGARYIEETVGLTGAIVKLSNGRVVAVGEPAYGGSRHTAQVLLLAARRWPSIRAALVAAYKESCLKRLRGEGLVVEAGPHRSPSTLLNEIAAALKETREEPVALASRGGPGLEPVIYIFGHDAYEVVERALRCMEV